MSNEHTKLKRALGFSASYGAAVGLVVSGTAMFSVSSVAASAGHAADREHGMCIKRVWELSSTVLPGCGRSSCSSR